jgi:hypothetical protein
VSTGASKAICFNLVEEKNILSVFFFYGKPLLIPPQIFYGDRKYLWSSNIKAEFMAPRGNEGQHMTINMMCEQVFLRE